MTQEQKEKIAKQYAWANSTLGIDKIIFKSEDTHMIPVCQMVRVPIYNKMETAVLFGLNYAEKNLWKPANGDDLPEIDREVVVLYQHYPLDVDEYSVGFAHRPPEYWDGKNIETGVVTRYYPKKYGKGGWNQPNVKWWLDLDLPKPKVEE